MNGYLLDTNVVSELRQPAPDPNVTAWLERVAPERLHIASLTVGELRRGACKLGDTRRARRILEWIDRLVGVQFAGRVLSFDLSAAMRWGSMMGESDRAGGPLPTADAQIASIALAHDLVPVTRNLGDFLRMSPRTVNPFEPTA